MFKRDMSRTPTSRRHFFAQAAAAGSLVFAATPAARASVCMPTPEQAEGPFYPVAHRLEEDTDLTWRYDRAARAQGEVIAVRGQVTDTDCAPIAHVLVEIWQACASGRYDHPTDENPAPLDPNFQYWGRSATDETGHYAFRTIKPGAYPDGPTWIRPPHIHFRVLRRGYLELTTQMYFAGEPYNDTDRILQRLPSEEQARVVIEPRQQDGMRTYTFNLGLTRA